MTVSIAIATFNGEKYIDALLQSLSKQSRLPDEVVISDDCSIDSTVEKLEKFAVSAPFKIKVLRSDVRQGVVVNFYKAFDACECDYIAYCDQDDVWDPRKIENCIGSLERHHAALLIHKSLVVDSGLKPLGYALPDLHGTRAISFPSAPYQIYGFGHQMVFRKDVLAMMRQLYSYSEVTNEVLCQNFDELIPMVAGAVGVVVFLDEPLVLFRRHDGSTSPLGKTNVQGSVKERAGGKRAEIEWYLNQLQVLLTAVVDGKRQRLPPLAHVSDEYVQYISRRVKWLEHRSVIHAKAEFTRSLSSLLRLIAYGAYGRKSAGGFGHRNLLGDSLAVLRIY